jgi:hypothetical protein
MYKYNGLLFVEIIQETGYNEADHNDVEQEDYNA